MRRILILNYFFPPLGGAAALRGVTLARRLPELGYEPVVVTGPGESFGRFRPQDDTLAVPGVTVRRISAPEPERATGWAARRDRWLALPGAWQRWLEDGFVETGRTVEGVDLVYADLGPDATAHAAARLARELGCPWVADLGDPWALDEMRVYQSAAHRLVDRASMRRALRSADAVVMNTAEAADALRRAFPEHRSHPVPALPVGYDAADFAGAEPERTDRAFRIVHTGSFHTEMALNHRRSERLRRLLRGGPEQAVDVLPRSPVFLAQAIRRAIAEDPSLAGRIELHLAGPLTQADRDALAGVPGVHELGFLRHPETIALMRSADLLFLPMHDLPEGGRVRIFPCKGYEYLASGRPILAALTDGDGRDLMQRAEGAFVVRPADVDAMAGVIAREAARPERRPSCARERAGVLHEVERRYLNERLAETFDTILGAPSVATAQERDTDPAIAGGASR